jgi:hypothetical protein
VPERRQREDPVVDPTSDGDDATFSGAGGWSQPVEDSPGELEGLSAANKWVQATQQTGKDTVRAGVTCSMPKDAAMRREEGALIAIQELGSCRAWLRRLKGEIAAGLRRVDAAIKALESDGPGQGRSGTGGPFKPFSRHEPKLNNKLKALDVGVGSGGGPRILKPKESLKEHMYAGEGTSTGLGLLVRPEDKHEQIGPGFECVGHPKIVTSGPGTNSPQRIEEMRCVSHQLPGRDPSLAKSGPEGMRGESGSSTGPTQIDSGDDVARGMKESRSQTTPMKCMRSSVRLQTDGLGPLRKCSGLPEGTIHGGMGILSRPNISWVAGRTGFGPVDSGKSIGLSNSGSVEVPRSNEALVDALGAAANSAGVGALLVSEVPEVVVSGGGQEDSYVEDSAEDLGLVVVAPNSLGVLELEASPVTKKLRRAGEVGSIVGLSCDGQEGMQMDCLKRIIVEQQGREGGSPIPVNQQEAESSVWERGNCSDYEA